MKTYTLFYANLLYGESDEVAVIDDAPSGIYCYFIPLHEKYRSRWYLKNPVWTEIPDEDVPVELKTLLLLMS